MSALWAYAFTLGLLAAVNPCGFALLPVYLPAFARVDSRTGSPARRVVRAVGAAVLVSAGFGVVFAAVGAAVSAGLGAITRWAPWAMVAIAVAMMVIGVATLVGRPIGGRLAVLAPRVRGTSMRSMFLFGVGYGVASLACALPVFLAGVAGAFLRAGFVAGLAAFVAYAAGMATVLTVLAVAIALGRGRAARLRRLSRYVEPLGGALLLVVGGYLAYYWVSLLVAPTAPSPLTGAVESAQATLAGIVDGAGVWLGVGVASAVLLVLVGTWLARHAGARLALMVLVPIVLVPMALVPIGLLLVRPATSAGNELVSAGAGSGDPRLSGAAQYLTAYTPLQPATAAPTFALTNQHGRRVSLTSLRGKIVVLAFLDDHCHDICLLYSPDMLAAAKDLGKLNRKVVFVGINVNPFHTGVADVASFTRREHLNTLPHWDFLTGSAAALRKVWRAYGETVQTESRAVQHQGTVYFLDQSGRERAAMSFGASSAHTARWGRAMATVVAGLAGAHPPTLAAGPIAGGPSGAAGPDAGGPGVTVAGHGRAPGFRLPLLRQPARELSLAGLSGRPLVVNFWASWCTPCQHEMPALRQAADRWRGRVNFVGITFDDQRTSALRVADRARLDYPSVFDAAGGVAAAYQVVNLPTTFFVSADGHVVARHTGAVSPAGLTRELHALTNDSAAG